ncbi:hypothetical protein D1007_44162 [Hordeum vulgare]|nr:hypothetical protein D1007_44162 [Hordeum vulgare]
MTGSYSFLHTTTLHLKQFFSAAHTSTLHLKQFFSAAHTSTLHLKQEHIHNKFTAPKLQLLCICCTKIRTRLSVPCKLLCHFGGILLIQNDTRLGACLRAMEKNLFTIPIPSKLNDEFCFVCFKK